MAAASERWRDSRVDVAESTKVLHRVALGRVLPILGTRFVDELVPADVADLIATLAASGYRRETISKSVTALAQTLDHAGVVPNPARDRVHVKLPRETKTEPKPPTAEHVLAVHRLLASAYRLPLLALDATGMRVGELVASDSGPGLTRGNVDEPHSRWRVSKEGSKTGRARWVHVPEVLFRAVSELCPRDDRQEDRRVFDNVTDARLRVAIGRACIAAGVPSFSPHDLRHRRISLEHLRGEPWAKIGELVGQRNLSVTANTYSHVMLDETELDYAELARWKPARTVQTPVQTPEDESASFAGAF